MTGISTKLEQCDSRCEYASGALSPPPPPPRVMSPGRWGSRGGHSRARPEQTALAERCSLHRGCVPGAADAIGVG